MSYKIKILQYACFLCLPSTRYPHMQNKEQIIEYFFPKIDYSFDDINYDLCITSICMDNNEILDNKKINIFISVENLTNPNFGWYTHYNKYGEYGNEKIDIYIYSHISKIIKNEKYLAIPCIYSRINYFVNSCNFYYNHEKLNCSFNNKKFCLIINKSGLNNNVLNKYTSILESIDKVDNINLYNDEIVNKSCYNSIELLSVFNKYKFILCLENSKQDGYITEKIFNCFFAKTIPLYWGANNINLFINEESYINIENDDWLNKVKILNENENEYDKFILKNKISDKYDDENYKNVLIEYINKVIIEKNIN